MAAKNLDNAKKAKKDEFYTQLTDIEKELKNYKRYFKGKTIFCNCDDPQVSKFFEGDLQSMMIYFLIIQRITEFNAARLK